MSELDPRLAALLRRAPAAPERLDDAHRAAVMAAARQSWFRQRARARRNLAGLAAAALVAAAVAGWTVRSLVETPTRTAEPVVTAAREERRSAKADADRDGAPAAFAAPVAAVAAAEQMPAKPASIAPPQAAANSTMSPPAAPAPLAADLLADKDGPAPPSALREMGAMDPMAKSAAPPAPTGGAKPAAAMAKRAAAVLPPGAHGRIVAATLVLDAALAGRLAEDDRAPTLQAAIDSLAGLDLPTANALRARLRAALAAP